VRGIIAIVPWQYLNVVGISIALMIGGAQGLQVGLVVTIHSSCHLVMSTLSFTHQTPHSCLPQGVQTTLQPTISYETAAASPVPLWGYIMITR
jgi:hypothetical protein